MLKLTLERQPQHYISRIDGGARWRHVGSCSYILKNGHGYTVDDFCAHDFHRSTGFRLKPGESQRIEIEIRKVA